SEVDSGVVAKLLAAVVEREEPDLVTLGKLAVDTENNQVGQRLAALLDWPQATFAYSCEIADGWATVGREVDGGTSTVRFKLPGVLTADLRLNTPRYASLPGIMKARSKPLDKLTPDDLDVEVEKMLQVVSYDEPPAREAGRIVEDVEELVDCLVNEAKAV
ncbi:MAG: electron transfer flavoprotein subunit beta/FixA family protein, partial [Myxococcota bacterium]